MSQIEKRLLINLIKKGFIKHDKSIDIKIDRKNYNIKSTDELRYLPDTSIVNGDCFTVSKFDGQNIIYTKRIYNNKSGDCFDYLPDVSMKENYLKAVSFFNRFYKYVQVIHMVEGSFNKSLVSSKDINNDLKFVIKNEIVRFSMDGSILKNIIIEDAFKKSKRKLIDDYKIINIIANQDISLIENMFLSVSEGINNENISFSLNQSLEILKKNLVLSEMVYI